jgi:hypothetical protein
MATVNDMIRRMKSLNVPQEAEEALYQSREEIIELQGDQLLHGKNREGGKIGKYKSDKYAAKKFAQNPLAGLGNMDWILTGELKRELFVDVRQQTYVIDTADPKAAHLIKDFGDPFGLTKESKVKLIADKTRPVLVKNVKAKLKV